MVYEKKMETALIPLQRALYPGLCWPTLSEPSRLEYVVHFFYRWISVCFYIIVPIMEISYMIQHTDDLSEFTEAAVVLFTAGVVNVKLHYLLIRQNSFQALIRDHLQSDYSIHMPFIQHVHEYKNEQFKELSAFLEETMDTDLKQCRFLYLSVAISIGGTLVLYEIIPALSMWYTSVYNPENYQLILPFRFAVPWDYDNSTALYTLTYFINIMAGWLTNQGFVGMDVTFGCVMVMMIRQCNVLSRLLTHQHEYALVLAGEGASQEEIEAQCYDLLSQWIDHYERILKEHVNIDKLGPVFFTQFCGASLTICLLAFKTDLETHYGLLATYFMYFTSASAQLMIYCWYGERLLHEGQGLGDVAYQSSWEDRSTRYQHALRMLIRQTQRHPRITAMGYWELSLPTFRAIYSTAVSYYTLLQSVGDKE